MATLSVPDEVVISFFSACVIAQSTAIILLWKKLSRCEKQLLECYRSAKP